MSDMSLDVMPRPLTIDSLPRDVLQDIVLIAALATETSKWERSTPAVSQSTAVLCRLARCKPFSDAALRLLERYISIKDVEHMTPFIFHFDKYPERAASVCFLDVTAAPWSRRGPHFYAEKKVCEQAIRVIGNFGALKHLRMSLFSRNGESYLPINLMPTLKTLAIHYKRGFDPDQHDLVGGHRQPQDLEYLTTFVADYAGHIFIFDVTVPVMPASLVMFDCLVATNDWELGPALENCVNLHYFSIEVCDRSTAGAIGSVVRPFAHKLKWLGLLKVPMGDASAFDAVNVLIDQMPNLRVICCDAVFVDFEGLCSPKAFPLLRAISVKEWEANNLAYHRKYFCCGPESFSHDMLDRFVTSHPHLEHMAVKRFLYEGGPQLDIDVSLCFPESLPLPRPSELSSDELERLVR